MRIYDISLLITENTPVWPGQPDIRIKAHSTVAKDGAAVSMFSFSSHTATHVDAPAHFINSGLTVDKLSLDKMIGPARVLDLTWVKKEINVEDIEYYNIKPGERILLKTANSKYLKKKDFYPYYIYLTAGAAEYLISLGVVLVGIDYLGIEKKGDPDHLVHKRLLANGIIIVEGLYLEKVPQGEYDLICLPLKIRGIDGAPVRAVLVQR